MVWLVWGWSCSPKSPKFVFRGGYVILVSRGQMVVVSKSSRGCHWPPPTQFPMRVMFSKPSDRIMFANTLFLHCFWFFYFSFQDGSYHFGFSVNKSLWLLCYFQVLLNSVLCLCKCGTVFGNEKNTLGMIPKCQGTCSHDFGNAQN